MAISLGLVALVVGTALTAAACGKDDVDGSTTTSGSAPSLAGSSWSFQGAARGGSTPTLEFGQSGQVAGSTGCNRFAGTYRQEGTKLRFELGPVTKAGCVSPALQSQEERILAALPEVRGSELRTDALVLTGTDGKELLSYSRVSGELAGTSWKVTGVNRNGGVETSALTEKLTADFAADGTVSGSGGCNTFRGSYTQDGTKVAITGLSSTLMGCEQDVMSLEQDYLAALQRTATATVSGTTLELRDASGAVQVTLRSGS